MNRNSMSKTAVFNLANDPDLIIAIMDAEDGAPPLQRHKFKTIGDRIRLIDKLAEHGFHIVKTESIIQS